MVRAHSRITTGLGREHPTEIGFTFHRWGAPYLPASGLKGVARRAAPDPESADQLFGNQDKKGSIVVLDGVIVTAGRGSASRFLELDVMNPHYPGYYRGQGLPSESDDPIPLTFLTIPKGASLSVVCAGRAEDHARDALEALIRGLSTFGFGAKTSSGYGWLETEEITYE
ncbi:MAG: type III-B CRISPR module RAMP protein Cmr6 [Acidobacterium ailaaui]|nr:type III-B CRISPR module RAMP protein Cmr6 [Pseudacidobacterium ailaaui]